VLLNDKAKTACLGNLMVTRWLGRLREISLPSILG
jgi:hypothetical protein